MNESETRAEYIDPKLKKAGWGEMEGSKVLREFRITEGRIQAGGLRAKPEIADYILVYRNRKIGVIEAKAENFEATEGVMQAKAYAEKLQIEYAFATNGKEIYQISMKSGQEGNVSDFPTPEELWHKTFSDENKWKEKFNAVPFEDGGTGKKPRYYQELSVERALDAIAEEKRRILLTLATGTGKTFIAFQIAWKLFQTRWNLKRDGERRPRILFLADRNILADQAFNAFSAFSEDALVRINPLDIRKKGGVPMSGSVYFTIFQTFMSGQNGTPYFGEYPVDFFDFIIIDECHRGGANDESNWRGILEYFSPAVQLGLTATPKRKDNVDTYQYFGEPVYIYSLKEGVNDGFLTPFKVKRIKTTLDDYVYTTDDQIIEGEVEEGKIYEEPDLIIVAAYGKILPKAVLELPGFGAINVHASLLPHYRGPSPIQNAILDGETETGVTIMLMDAGIDTGAMLSQKKTKIDPDETGVELSEKLARLSIPLLLETINLWIERKITPQEQKNNCASLCQLIERSDGKVIWLNDAQSIYNQYRAFYAWPGIFTYWQREKSNIRLKINKLSLGNTTSIGEHSVGEVFQVSEKVAVQTGAGIIFLEEVQMEGKNNLKIKDFINGNPKFIGSILK